MRTTSMFVLALACVPRLAVGQTSSPRAANPERPTVATHAYTVAPGHIELEQGFRLVGVEELSESSGWDFNLKIGMGPSLQLGFFGAGYVRTAAGSGVGDIGWALKWKRPFGERAAVALVPAVTVPSGDESRGHGAGQVLGSLVAVYSADLAETFHIDVNLGPTAIGAGRVRWFTSLGASGSAGRAGWAVEWFEYRSGSGLASESGVLGAVLFSVAEWAVLDIGGVLGLGNLSPNQLFLGATTNVGRVF